MPKVLPCLKATPEWEKAPFYAEEKRRGKESDLAAIDVSKNRSWRGFQLAFILLNLPSITDLNHRGRTHPTEAIADRERKKVGEISVVTNFQFAVRDQ